MRGVGGQLFKGGDYFQYFCLRRLGVAIIRGRQLIKGWLLFKEIWYFYLHMISIDLLKAYPQSGCFIYH